MGADGLLIICDGETWPAGVELVADEGEGNVHTKTGGLKLEMGANKGREGRTLCLLVVTLETAVCWQWLPFWASDTFACSVCAERGAKDRTHPMGVFSSPTKFSFQLISINNKWKTSKNLRFRSRTQNAPISSTFVCSACAGRGTKERTHPRVGSIN